MSDANEKNTEPSGARRLDRHVHEVRNAACRRAVPAHVQQRDWAVSRRDEPRRRAGLLPCLCRLLNRVFALYVGISAQRPDACSWHGPRGRCTASWCGERPSGRKRSRSNAAARRLLGHVGTCQSLRSASSDWSVTEFSSTTARSPPCAALFSRWCLSPKALAWCACWS